MPSLDDISKDLEKFSKLSNSPEDDCLALEREIFKVFCLEEEILAFLTEIKHYG